MINVDNNASNYLGILKTYTPEMFGVSNVDTEDTTIIRNNTINFNLIPSGAKIVWLKPGSTYVIDDEINSIVTSNTIVYGNFATIKRCNATKTTLAAAAALGANSFTVANSTGLRVGDYFTITNNNAAAYAGKGDQENSNRGGDLDTIASINGNVITLTNGTASGLRLPENGELDGAGQYPIGSNVIRTFNMWGLGVANDNIKMENVIFDGNVSGNNFTYDWRVNNTGALEGEQMQLIGCHFLNLPSENIICSGRIHFDRCHIENTTGGIMHGSTEQPTVGKNGYWVTNCTGKNVGQHAVEAGHSDAFVTFSASVQEVWILNNDIQNDLSGSTKINSGYVFGTVGFTATLGDDYSDGKVYVRGNLFTNFKNISSIHCNTADLNQNVRGVNIEDNEFINCGDLLVRGNAITNGGGIRDMFFNRNTVTNGRLFFEEVYGLEVIGNKLKQEEDFSFPSTLVGLSNVNTVGHVYIKSSNVKIKNNLIVGKTANDDYCKRGIFATSSTKAKDSGGTDTEYGYYQNIEIEGNTVRNHHEYEIATSAETTATARVVELVGWSVANNKVFAQKDSTAEKLIMVDPGVRCYSNLVYTFLAGQTGIQGLGIHNTTGPITTCRGPHIRHNEVYGPSTNPIKAAISNNTYNTRVEYNITQIACTDGSGGNSVLANNIVVATTGTPYYINEDEDSDEY